jgi:hypothetical protein
MGSAGNLPALPSGLGTPSWLSRFVTDLAYPDEDPNSGIEIVIPLGVS